LPTFEDCGKNFFTIYTYNLKKELVLKIYILSSHDIIHELIEEKSKKIFIKMQMILLILTL